MPKQCEHDKLISIQKSRWYMLLDKNLISIELTSLMSPP